MIKKRSKCVNDAETHVYIDYSESKMEKSLQGFACPVCVFIGDRETSTGVTLRKCASVHCH